MKYKAFISYKHSEYSRKQAEALERALKRYAKPLLQAPIKIFRDEKHMVPGDGLSQLIKNGLDNSEYLIFLAEKEAAQSVWCQDELEYWCNGLGRAKKLIIVHIGDRISFDLDNDRIDWAQTSALPALLQAFITSIPLYADLAWIQKDQDSDLENIRYRGIINTISAKFRGITPEEINDEEIRDYRRNKRLRNLVIFFLSVLLILSSFTTWWALEQQGIANVERMRAEDSASVAQQQRLFALDQQRIARDSAQAAQEQRLYALLQRETAEIERDRARIAQEKETIQRLLAQEESDQNRRLAISNSNALTAKQLARLDPTFAVRLAEMNYHLYPESETAAGIFREIFSDPKFCVKTITKGHRSDLTSVAFSPDGQSVLTGNYDKTAKLWDLNGNELITFSGHSSPVTSVTFSPDGSYLITGSADKTARLWEISGQELQTLSGHTDIVWSVAFSPDSKRILTGSLDKTAKLWDLDGNELISFSGHAGNV